MIGFQHHQLLLLVLSASFVVSRERNTNSYSSLHPEFVYHSEDWLLAFLRKVTEAFPHLTRVYSIGKSTQGLSAACISLCDYCFILNLITALMLLFGIYIIILTTLSLNVASEPNFSCTWTCCHQIFFLSVLHDCAQMVHYVQLFICFPSLI